MKKTINIRTPNTKRLLRIVKAAQSPEGVALRTFHGFHDPGSAGTMKKQMGLNEDSSGDTAQSDRTYL